MNLVPKRSLKIKKIGADTLLIGAKMKLFGADNFGANRLFFGAKTYFIPILVQIFWWKSANKVNFVALNLVRLGMKNSAIKQENSLEKSANKHPEQI